MSESFEPETGEMIVKRVSVPIGLEELMEGLTKEVLLKKPDDIYLFAADYFSRLLLLREKGSYKVKTLRNAQSAAKQTPKQPLEKLLIRGASKQLSRQLSIRGESPIKRVTPIKRPPARLSKEDKEPERHRFMDRRRSRKSEETEAKVTETKQKSVVTTPRSLPEKKEDKLNTLNKRDRSLSNARRGRSTNRSAQITPRQKSTSTPRKSATPSDEISAKTDDKVGGKKEKLPAVVSSIKEREELGKDSKLVSRSPEIKSVNDANKDTDKEHHGIKDTDKEHHETNSVEEKDISQKILSSADTPNQNDSMTKEKKEDKDSNSIKADEINEKSLDDKEKVSSEKVDDTTKDETKPVIIDLKASSVKNEKENTVSDTDVKDVNKDADHSKNNESSESISEDSGKDKIQDKVVPSEKLELSDKENEKNVEEHIKETDKISEPEEPDHSEKEQSGTNEVKKETSKDNSENNEKIIKNTTDVEKIDSDSLEDISKDTSVEEKHIEHSEKVKEKQDLIHKDTKSSVDKVNEKDSPVEMEAPENDKNKDHIHDSEIKPEHISGGIARDDENFETTSKDTPSKVSGKEKHIHNENVTELHEKEESIKSDATLDTNNKEEIVKSTSKLSDSVEEKEKEKVSTEIEAAPASVKTDEKSGKNIENTDTEIPEVTEKSNGKDKSKEETDSMSSKEGSTSTGKKVDSSSSEESEKLSSSSKNTEENNNQGVEVSNVDNMKSIAGSTTETDKPETNTTSTKKLESDKDESNVKHIGGAVNNIKSEIQPAEEKDIVKDSKDELNISPVSKSKDTGIGKCAESSSIQHLEESAVKTENDNDGKNIKEKAESKDVVQEQSKNDSKMESKLTHDEKGTKLQSAETTDHDKKDHVEKDHKQNDTVANKSLETPDTSKDKEEINTKGIIDNNNTKENEILETKTKSITEGRDKEHSSSSSSSNMDSTERSELSIETKSSNSDSNSNKSNIKDEKQDDKKQSSSDEKNDTEETSKELTKQSNNVSFDENVNKIEENVVKSTSTASENKTNNLVRDTSLETAKKNENETSNEKHLQDTVSTKELINNDLPKAVTESENDKNHNDIANVINSVLSVVGGGLLNQRIKTCIGDFIQNEQQHVFTETPNLVNNVVPGSAKEKPEALKNDQLNNIDENRILTQEKLTDSEKVREQTSHSENVEGKIDPDPIKEKSEVLKNDQLNNIEENHVLTQEKLIDNEKNKEHTSQSENDEGKIDPDPAKEKTKVLKNVQLNNVVEENHMLTHEKLTDREKVKEQTSQSENDEDKMEDIIKSVISISNSVPINEKTKTYINSFIQSEKEHVFMEKPSAPPSDDKNENVDIDEEMGMIPNDKLVDTHKLASKVEDIEDKEQTDKTQKANGKDKSATEKSSGDTNDKSEQNKKTKEERKMRRVKTVDVIRDDSHQKVQIKSRIPTADYRNRVKRDTSGKHPIRLQRSLVSNENIKAVVKDISNRDEVNTITKNLNVDEKQANKSMPEIATEKSDNNITNHNKEGQDLTKPILQEPSEHKEQNVPDSDKGSFDISKLRQELKDVENEAKVVTIESLRSPYSPEKESNKVSKDDVTFKEIVAAIKIQSLWRGFKMRQNKKEHSEVQEKVSSIEKIEKPNAKVDNSDKNTISDKQKGLKIEEATVLIQKIWRGFKVRKQLLKTEKTASEQKMAIEHDTVNNKEAKDVPTADEKETKSVDKESHLDDSEKFVKAATMIQKIWRGFKVRKANQHKPKKDINTTPELKMEDNQTDKKKPKQEIDLNNVEQQILTTSQDIDDKRFRDAAIMIQKIWRGFKVRKVKHSKPESNSVIKEKPVKEEEIKKEAIDNLNSQKLSELKPAQDEQFVKAAVLIQKIWRGFKVRKGLKNESKQKDDSTKANETATVTVNGKKSNAKQDDTIVSESIVLASAHDLKSETLKEEKPEKEAHQKSSELKFENDFAKAAIQIQKIWRGFKVRQALKKTTATKDEEKEKEKITDSGNKNLTQTPSDVAKSKQSHTEDEFAEAAILIQKIWRGFKVRKSLKKSKSETVPKIEKEEKLKDTLQETIVNEQVSKQKSQTLLKAEQPKNQDEFVKAAILIQKIWRGFKVRKLAQEKKLFGKRIDTEQQPEEIIKEVDAKDKKSALKIQSLWRGYQVRKNINVIKNKLQDGMRENDADKGKELTDGDILNAATKIQAGVRGYLQRKKYKTDANKLNSISEEDDGKPSKLKQDETNNEKHTDGTTTQGEKLSEDEVLKALEDLNKVEVPNDTPILHETHTPKFYRSNTVQEPEILRTNNPLLYKSVSIDRMQGLENVAKSNITGIDDNNNTPDKENRSFLLEKPITPTTKNDEESHIKLASENIHSKDEVDKGLVYEESSKLQTLSNSVETAENKSNNKIDTDMMHVHINHDYNKTMVNDNETLIQFSSTETEKDNSDNLSKDIGDSGNKNSLNNIRNETSDDNNLHNDTKREISEKNTSHPLLQDENDDTEKKTVYERPLSMDSNDSAVTVIYKGTSDSKDSLDNTETDSVTDHTEMENKVNEAENLINDFQNKLLDQISGKDTSVENTINKFDIQKLRQELEEAGLIHNNHENMRHENSREIIDEHDQLLDYVKDLSSIETDLHESLSRDLPDIKEEDQESKASVEVKQQSEESSNKDLNVEKIKSTLKECEDIAREINMGFNNVHKDQIDKIQTESSPEKQINSNGSAQFCGTKEGKEYKTVPNDVEIITPVNSTQANDKIYDQNNSAKDSLNQNSVPLNGLLHTGELHDSIVVPASTEADAKSKNLDCVDNMNVELSKTDSSDNQNSKLLHTGELHDIVVVPLPLEVENNLHINDKEHTTAEVTELSAVSNTDTPKVNDNNKSFTLQKLLHTGELHDSLITPLPIKLQQSSTENCEKLQKTAQEDFVSPQKVLVSETSSKQDSAEPSGLLHTGEMHDSIVIPLPREILERNVDDAKRNVGNAELENTPRQVDSECQTNGDTAIEVQLNEVPAGVKALTSSRPVPAVRDVSDVADHSAQTPDKGALPNAPSSDFSAPSDSQSMESQTRDNTTVNNKSMEAEAATKIQAGFRGYQVRKQLKLKNGSSDINNQKRQLRRKSSGRLSEANRTPQNKPKDANELEEKSAVKIQAGVRGFLVRRRQKKLKNQES